MQEAHTDGRFYELNDMAKAGSGNCEGCSACCRGMGDSIKLDPRDIFEIQKKTGVSFEKLMEKYVSISVYDGMILPCLSMKGVEEACSFLEKERCSIHDHRPGLCRLFPLGRNFEDGKMNYILLKDTCNRNMVKVKVGSFIGISDAKTYEEYVITWHYFVKDMQEILSTLPENQSKNVNMFLLNKFFVEPYDLEKDFYEQFYGRYSFICEQIGLK